MFTRKMALLGFSFGILPVFFIACSPPKKPSKTLLPETPENAFGNYLLGCMKAYPINLKIPEWKKEYKFDYKEASKKPMPELDETKSKYWVLSFGKHKIPQQHFKHRAYLYTRLNGPILDFDFLRKVTAEELQNEFCMERWEKKNPGLVQDSEVEKNLDKHIDSLKPEPYTTWVEGAPFIGYGQKVDPSQNRSNLNMPKNQWFTSPNLSQLTGLNPGVNFGPKTITEQTGPRVLKIAKPKIPQEILDKYLENGADIEIKGEVIYVRNRIFRTEEELKNYFRKKIRTQMIIELASTSAKKKREN